MDIQSVVSKIRNTFVDHPIYDLTYRRLYNQSAMAQSGSVITVVGPTRVGKTRLSLHLQGVLVDPESQSNSQDIPIIRVDAATTDQGFISTRYLTLQMLLALEHPFHVHERYAIRLNDSEATLRRHLVAALIARKTKYIIFDEAHHLLRTKSNRVAESVLDSMKCLGNETGCVIIFIGGYDLLGHQFLSAHLNGRMTVIEFPNYGSTHQGLQGFDRLLVTLDEWLPWRKGSSLYQHRDRIHEGTLGCYGQLVHWTISALAEMNALGESRLRLAHYTCTRRLGQIRIIKDDIERGKQMVADLNEVGHRQDYDTQPVLTAKSNHRPFHRRPARDAVGQN